MIRRLLTLAMLIPAFAVTACGGGDGGEAEQPAATEEPAATATATQDGGGEATAGREQFVTTCGGCHTLSDAGTTGQVGPDLDELAPDEQRVLEAIESGPGAMPPNLLEGEDAQQVAEYVAGSAGG